MRSLLAALALAACATPAPTPTTSTSTKAAAHHGGAIEFHGWDKPTFEQAKAEKKLLLVTLVTEWCHWCHVMDEKTWGDPAIAQLMKERFVVVRVDADSRPDLAERYADFGWPALALLTPDAQPVTEWKGYQEARRFERELRGYVKDLDEGRVLARKPPVVDVEVKPLGHIRDFTRAQLASFYDDKRGGWGKGAQKYPMWAPISWALLVGVVDGDAAALAQARQTLDGELHLIDGVDGGMFQYSLEGVWTAPHYEKLAEINGTALENYADAWAATGDVGYLKAAQDLARYAMTTLRRADGAFFANQDADVGTRGEHEKVLGKEWYALSRAERAKRGEPFIDRHVYASHNGRIVAGLARLAAVSGDDDVKAAAVKAIEVVLARHKVGAGYRHAERSDEGSDDDGVLHLADQVAVGRALLLLSEVTGDARYRAAAHDVAAFIVASFEDNGGGFFASTASDHDVGVFAERRKPMKQNAEAARLLLQIGRLDDDKALVDAAERGLAAFAKEGVVKEEYRMVGELLLALEEDLREPLHFAVVGDIADPATKALLASSLKVWAPHRLVDVQLPGKKYPDLGKPSLYICGATFCSPPITDPAQVAAKSARYLKPAKG